MKNKLIIIVSGLVFVAANPVCALQKLNPDSRWQSLDSVFAPPGLPASTANSDESIKSIPESDVAEIRESPNVFKTGSPTGLPKRTSPVLRRRNPSRLSLQKTPLENAIVEHEDTDHIRLQSNSDPRFTTGTIFKDVCFGISTHCETIILQVSDSQKKHVDLALLVKNRDTLRKAFVASLYSALLNQQEPIKEITQLIAQHPDLEESIKRSPTQTLLHRKFIFPAYKILKDAKVKQ